MKCIRRHNRLGTKGLTYGQVKAIAHSSLDPKINGHALFANYCDNIAIEAHLFKIAQAISNRKYKDKKNKLV